MSINPYLLLVEPRESDQLFIIGRGDEQQFTEHPAPFYGDGWKILWSLRDFENRIVIRDEQKKENLFVLKVSKPKQTFIRGGLVEKGVPIPTHAEAMKHGGKARVRAEYLANKPATPKKRKKRKSFTDLSL